MKLGPDNIEHVNREVEKALAKHLEPEDRAMGCEVVARAYIVALSKLTDSVTAAAAAYRIADEFATAGAGGDK